jgi:hypothetical protein
MNVNNLLLDPSSDEFFTYLKQTAVENTNTYISIFKDIYPTNEQRKVTDIVKTNYENLDSNDKRDLILKYNRLKKFISGHIVEFPLEFLCDEKLHRPTICKERLVPIKNFL